MAMFKVALHRRLRDNYHGHEPNPFLAPLPPPGKTHSMSVREWTFEAEDEAEVRRLLQEARDKGIPGIQGYSLRSIEKLPVSKEPKHG
jgi:hypothetical protein